MSLDNEHQDEIIHEKISSMDVEVEKEDPPSEGTLGSLFLMGVLAVIVYLVWTYFTKN
ncbi:MAG: hypothetical protein AAB276_04465 [Pseudomonadota bacterium]